MKLSHVKKEWKSIQEDGVWKVRSFENKLIATIEKSREDKVDAKLLAASPIMFEALSSLVELIGEEDLPDNGELSGAAICDLARSAVAIASGKENWPFS
jgi:hypothetical protein